MESQAKIDLEALDLHINGLIDVSKSINEEANGSKQTVWLTRLLKFQSSYIKSSNPLGWVKMFSDFYTTHKAKIDHEIFTDNGETSKVNDEWLKTTASNEGSSSSKSWGPKSMTCKGLVIYFDPKIVSVSIPISEIYLTAAKLSKERGDDDVKIFAYPAYILYHLYSIFDCINLKESLNVTTLKAFIDEISPVGESEDTGKGFKGFGKILSGLAKQIGIGSGIDGKKIESFMEDTFKGDAMKNIGTIVSKVKDTIGSGADLTDTGSVLNKLSDVLKDKEVQGMLAGMTSSGEPAAEVAPPSFESSADPAEQE